MRRLTTVFLCLFAALTLAGALASRAAPAFAQAGGSFRDALTPAEQVIYDKRVKDEQARWTGYINNNVLNQPDAVVSVDRFASSNAGEVASLTQMLNNDIAFMRATKATAAANGERRQAFARKLAMRDAQAAVKAKMPDLRAIAVKQEADFKRVAAAKAPPPAPAAAAGPPPPAWLTALPGYRPSDAVAFARCNTMQASCGAPCDRYPPAGQPACRNMCVAQNKTCLEQIRFATYERPLNNSNPLTRLYARREEIYNDPNYNRANAAWRACLYARDGRVAEMEDHGRCQRLNPDNAIRQ